MDQSIITNLTGDIPYDLIETKAFEEVVELYQKSYFHNWQVLFNDNEEAFETIKKSTLKFMKENEIENLDNHRLWILLQLQTQLTIANVFLLHLLIQNIENSLEEIEDGDIDKLLESINIYLHVLISMGCVNYSLRYSKFEEFGVEPNIECDVLPTLIDSFKMVKECIANQCEIKELSTLIVDEEIGELVIDHNQPDEAFELVADYLILKFQDELNDLLMHIAEESQSEQCMIKNEELIEFIYFVLNDNLSETLLISKDKRTTLYQNLTDLLLATIIEDLMCPDNDSDNE